MLTVLSPGLFLKDITLAIENNKSFAAFLNVDALNLAGAIDRTDGLLSAHAMFSVNWSDLTQRRPNKM